MIFNLDFTGAKSDLRIPLTPVVPVLMKAAPVYSQLLSRVQLFAAPWAVGHQAPLSMEILQGRIQASELPFPSAPVYTDDLTHGAGECCVHCPARAGCNVHLHSSCRACVSHFLP